MSKRWMASALSALALVGVAGVDTGEQARAQEGSGRPLPNILVIVVDDQSQDLFSRTLMPNVFSKLVDRGVKAERAYVNTSQCCPSRAQILTGLFGHHTGVDGNRVPLQHPTIVELLKAKGYRTAVAGKYLNSWPCSPRPEFDLWACIKSSNEHASLVDPILRIDGKRKVFKGYQSEVLTDLLARFVDQTPADQPFFGLYTTTSPHMPANDRRYRELQVPFPNKPSYDEDTENGDKPAYVRRTALEEREVAKARETYRKMARATRGLDDSIARLLQSLGDRADDTAIFYISDNGFLYGEHRLMKKVVPYEESVNVPFAMRYPALGGPGGVTTSALVQNVDIASTIAELVGERWGGDGTSLVPLLEGGTLVRDAALIENCYGANFPCHGTAKRGARRVPSYTGVVTDRYKYVEYLTGEVEMYDLLADPHELDNIAGENVHAPMQGVLDARLASFMTGQAPETTVVSGPPQSSTNPVARFRYFSQELDATYRCRLVSDEGAGPWLGCGRFTDEFGPLEPGEYTFEVAASNGRTTDPTPDTWSFQIEGPSAS